LVLKDKDKDFNYSYLLQVAAKPTIAREGREEEGKERGKEGGPLD